MIWPYSLGSLRLCCLALCLALAFAGCGSDESVTGEPAPPGGDIGSGGGGGGSSSQFVYTANRESDDIFAFTLNSSSGGLTTLAGSPFGAGSLNFPREMAAHPSAPLLFVSTASSDTSDFSSGVAVFSIASDGTLSAVEGSPFSGLRSIGEIEVHPSGNFVYVSADSFQDTPGKVAGFSVNTETGALTPVPGSPRASGNPHGMSFHSSGDFLYVANFITDEISAFSVDSAGSLTPVSGSPFKAGDGNSCLINTRIDAPCTADVLVVGDFLYFVRSNNISGSSVFAFRIDASTGSISAVEGSPFEGSGSAPTRLASNGGFLYVANFGIGSVDSGKESDASNITVFAIDSTTGALTQVAGSPFAVGTEPHSLAFDKSKKFLYAAQPDGDSVAAYSVDGLGALQPVAGSPFAAGEGPIDVTTWP